MPVFNLFSRRNQDSTQAESDSLIYDHVPRTVRNQIIHIWDSSIGSYETSDLTITFLPNNNKAWHDLRNTVCRERGFLQLSNHPHNPRADCIDYLLSEKNVYNVLDIVEISFSKILEFRNLNRDEAENIGITQHADDAIKELNVRFRRANLGYQFESGQIVRTDNLVTHETIVKPALSFLADSRFSGAENEFLTALKHYREGSSRDAITAANSAFESTLKTICEIKHWQYNRGDTAGRLLRVVRQNGLFPDYMERSFEQLSGTLQSGLTPIRNRESSSHGQGADVKMPPEYITEYALNLCATQILYLMKSMFATMK